MWRDDVRWYFVILLRSLEGASSVKEEVLQLGKLGNFRLPNPLPCRVFVAVRASRALTSQHAFYKHILNWQLANSTTMAPSVPTPNPTESLWKTLPQLAPPSPPPPPCFIQQCCLSCCCCFSFSLLLIHSFRLVLSDCIGNCNFCNGCGQGRP